MIETIYIYSDESGTFDYIHNDYFLFGGLIFFSKDEKDIAARKYSHAEKVIKHHYQNENIELKACYISNGEKGKLYRSLNQVYKFCVVIKQKQVNRKIFSHKKHKQRYLDFAYKMVLRKCLETLINEKHIFPRKVKFVIVNTDEHVTATDGIYELRESLLNEFKNGTFNYTWDKHFSPLFPQLLDVELKFWDSKSNFLIRAADIISNHCYTQLRFNQGDLDEERNMFVYYLPSNYIGHKGLEYFESSQNIISEVKS